MKPLEKLRKLQTELKKFSNARIPDAAKKHLSIAINFDINEKTILPLNPQSSIPAAFSLIVSNQKLVKSHLLLISSMIDVLEYFDNQSLQIILKSIEQVLFQMDEDISLKLLQTIPTFLIKSVFSFNIISSIFSISVSLITHENSLISTTAFASTQQMITLLFEYGKKVKVDQTTCCKIKEQQFTHPVFAESFLLLRDFSNLTQNKQPTFIHVSPFAAINEMWESILISNHKFIKMYPFLLKIIEKTLLFLINTSNNQSHNPANSSNQTKSESKVLSNNVSKNVSNKLTEKGSKNNPKSKSLINSHNISYLSATFRYFSDYFPETSCKFINQILNNNLSYVDVVFLRSVLIRRPDLCFIFDVDLLNKLFQYFYSNCDETQKKPLINASLSSIGIHTALSMDDKSKQTFIRNFSIEIAIIVISAFNSSTNNSNNNKTINHSSSVESVNKSENEPNLTENSSNENLSKNFYKNEEISKKIESTWQGILAIILKGIRLSDPLNVDIIFRAFNLLLSISSQFCINECSSILLRILCAFVAKQKLFRETLHPLENLSNALLHSNVDDLGFKKKRAIAYQMLLSLLYNSPHFFTKFYQRLFISLGMYPHASIDAQFTQKISTDELSKMCVVLCQGTPFCINFLKDVLVVNKERYEFLWPSIVEHIPKWLISPDYVDTTLNLLNEVLLHCFDESVLIVLNKSIESIHPKKKIILMNLTRQILAHSSNKIENRWGELLSVIQPYHCGNDSELLGTAFASLSIICNDHFQKLSESDMQACISSVFEFAAQRVDINIALSSLGLLWVITPFIHQISRFWKRILSETLILFNDPRSDVATCALRTFFSLLSSNTGQMPTDIYDHLIASCFIPLLMTFTSFRAESWAVQQLALLEICHCACSFWQQFESNPQFISNFWPLLIEKQQNFVMNCENQETNVAALQFYEEAFKCSKIDSTLREAILLSFIGAINHFMTHESPGSLVISRLGSFFVATLPTQKEYLTSRQLELWLGAIESIALILPSTSFVNLTAQKVIDSAFSLFPIKNEFALSIIRTLCRICSKTPCTHLRNSIFNILSKIITTKVERSNVFEIIPECSILFAFNEADSFIRLIIDFDFEITEQNCHQYFYIFNKISKNEKYNEQVKKTLIQVLPMIDNGSQIHFLNENSHDVNLLITIWNRFCNDNSFNQQFFDTCSMIILNHIFEKMKPQEDEKVILQILTFIEKSETKFEIIGDNEKCQKWHIYGVIPYLVQLLNDSREKVKTLSRQVFKIIHQDLGKLVL
ncbi:hypothetical protein TRFO_17241 [Tritrichomonas foetus]|uniref:Mon2/Sec7/BIG1-like dimerisation and cyclophilin-binding domain-containing protein n=1 Tax=Tritrichomonas foetus TaxID=1144522 RepID=A0A1J4KPE4_9EUKA|nr:hypothetical protein TRFO_17241 [Tritrichomonas foetus]|eukprot:OHT12784.1 hypothetical protein TRFO_17241 [Tritrichomonas foetus]